MQRQKIATEQQVKLPYAFCQRCPDKPMHTAQWIVEEKPGFKKVPVCEEYLNDKGYDKASGRVYSINKC